MVASSKRCHGVKGDRKSTGFRDVLSVLPNVSRIRCVAPRRQHSHKVRSGAPSQLHRLLGGDHDKPVHVLPVSSPLRSSSSNASWSSRSKSDMALVIAIKRK